MSRYFLNLVEASGELYDPDGVDVAYDELMAKALDAARDCIAADVLNGLLDLRSYIDVRDEAGVLILRQLFSDAVRTPSIPGPVA